MPTMPVPAGFFVTSPFGPRWGTTHYGTDFGRGGGSGGHPVYAVKDGTVMHSGPATGFGRWVVLDHASNVGGGTTVYGHVVPEVRVGQFIKEGQRIAHIDPNKGTNGGVAPHLHLEFHKYSWEPPGPNRLDPMATVLKGARWKGSAPAKRGKSARPSGVIFGIDVSEHQNGLSLKKAKAEGFDFAILRLCDGTYQDKTFRSHLADAESAGMLVSTYWYLRAPSEGTTIAQQVDVIDKQMAGRRDLGVWIDVESVRGSTKLLTEKDVWEAKRELERRGYHVPGIYSGAWYWEHMPGGEPSMDGLGYLWVSNYGRNAKGTASVTYNADGGNQHRGWSYPLGDRKPDILQFGSNGQVAGHFPVDVNAFKGTREQLQRIFSGKRPTLKPQPKKEDPLMANLDSNRTKWVLDQLAGPGKNKQGEPTYNGWDMKHLANLARERLDAGKGLTMPQMLALSISNQAIIMQKLEEK
ncbi:peptidoglycan DD-metalloendopeptidase family protein [Corynebacterium incognita]|uniref:Peptidoglycan DD-metalloendopeptidase family protein n=1 Tax=Corynebacterium incognita TaxID=2754725 RepID=A0A7G7CRN4_9CORY|nr:GH25 family lysozyme [Corynebacterium incognita]QNE90250.1 peptidoglycan DD-metalloendopeptidase family protein [Corynebacterium incognita]